MHTCKCGETDLNKFRIDNRRNAPYYKCRQCDNKARKARKAQKRQEAVDSIESKLPLENKLTTSIQTDEQTGIITASVTTLGAPAKPRDFLIERGLDPDEYEILDSKIGCWPTTMKIRGENGVETPVQIPNFKLEVKFAPIKLKPFEFEPIKSLRIEIKDSKPRVRSPQKKMRKALILPDSQNGFQRDLITGELFPFHDRRCWDLAFQMIDIWQPDDVILLGDMLDMCESGTYTSSLEMKTSMELAIHEVGFCLGKIRQKLPESKISWIPGNHEKRMDRAIMDNFSQGYGVKKYNHYKMPNPKYPAMSVPFLAGLEDIGVDWLEDYPNGILNFGLGCEGFHGTQAKTEGGDTARAYLNNGQKSCVYGHIHRNEVVWKTTYMHGQPQYKFAASPGTFAVIGGRLPAVKKRSNQQNGMLRLTYDPDGYDIKPEPDSIINGEMFFQGEKLIGDFDMEELCDTTGYSY